MLFHVHELLNYVKEQNLSAQQFRLHTEPSCATIIWCFRATTIKGLYQDLLEVGLPLGVIEKLLTLPLL